MESPKFRTRHMPTKISKPPKKGKGAKYDRKKEKKDWKKTESKLAESPDYIHEPGLGWDEGSNHPFGYFKGKFYYGEYMQTHGQMGDDQIDPNYNDSWRNVMKFPGRVWVDKKVFSLWSYPTTQSDWKKLIADLTRATKSDVLNKWRVELIAGYDRWGNRIEKETVPVKGLMIQLAKNAIKVDKGGRVNSQDIEHLKSPLKKTLRDVPMGWGSKNRPGGLTATQYHQKMQTSDGVIRLKPLVEEILRKRNATKE